VYQEGHGQFLPSLPGPPAALAGQISAAATLVERVSRYLCPVALPHGHDADSVKDALFDAVKDLPAHLRNSLTWDQGTEMARHAALTLAADLRVYFAHAHSPWERVAS
jgi:IS30 family transposase